MKQIMRIISFVLNAMLLVSCAEGYNITGTALQSMLDGDMVQLKPIDSDVSVDSCRIVHGKFSMHGSVDSVMCVRLFLGNEVDNIPIVLERGNIIVSAQGSTLKVEGTPLNDKFYAFMSQRDSLNFLLLELPRKQSTMILEGYDYDEILRQLGEEEAAIRMAIDKVETQFVTSNFDNVLGLTYFLVLCNNAFNQYGFATTTPQIDEIYSLAPEEFRLNKNVVKYMEMCEGK